MKTPPLLLTQSLRFLTTFKIWRGGGEVKNIGSSSRGHEFNSQQPHCGSHPSMMRFVDLFCCASIHEDRALYT